MYVGSAPMCWRQASNWASRAGFTEVARTTFKMSNYGMWGEIGSGVIGGIGSCWNTPIETIRVWMQRDISMGKEAKTFGGYWEEIVEDSGIGLGAAKAAGISCIVTKSSYTAGEDFTGADMIVEELGDDPATGVTLETLTSLLK